LEIKNFKMMTNYEEMLPIEKWQQVFLNLPPGDVCNVMKTSRYMNSLASWPELWKNMKVNMGKVKEKGLQQLYAIDRFRKITKMDFSIMIFTNQELERILTDIQGSPLENIDLSQVNLRNVPAVMLASTVASLHTVNLCNTRLTTDQCVKLLEASISSNTLVEIDLMHVNLSEVPAELLARAVTHLQTVNLSYTDLTTDQCMKVLEVSIAFHKLINGSANVDLIGVNLSRVPAELLVKAVSRLHTVNLSNTRLTTDQCIKVLEATISSNRLVEIDLKHVNLSGVPPDLLARAVSRLHTVDLSSTRLTTDQCVEVLEASISFNSLVNLNLKNVDFGWVSADLLARAVSCIFIDLPLKELNSDQLVRVLEDSTASNKLAKLGKFIGVNLSGVSAELLVKAISPIHTVDLGDTQLTNDQCVKVLETCISSNTLVNVGLRRVNLSKVPAELLARAVSCLQSVNLMFTKLTTDQCVKVVEAANSSKTLVQTENRFFRNLQAKQMKN